MAGSETSNTSRTVAEDRERHAADLLDRDAFGDRDAADTGVSPFNSADEHGIEFRLDADDLGARTERSTASTAPAISPPPPTGTRIASRSSRRLRAAPGWPSLGPRSR